jgi:hypothetical protein
VSPFVLVSIFAGPVLAIVIIVLIMKTLGGQQKEIQRILQTGQPAQARVLQLQHTGSSVSFGAHRHLNLVIAMEVHMPGRPPYQIQSTQLISELTLPSLQPGAWLQIRVDNQNPQNVAIAGYGQQAAAPAFGGAPGAPAMGGPMGAPMGAQMGFAMPNTAATMNKAFSRAIIMTLVISVIVTVPLLAVFVDWSAFAGGGGGDDDSSSKSDDKSASGDDSSSGDGVPSGGYCKGLVRCCKEVFGTSGNCDNYANLPAAGCKSAYDAHQKSAKAMGKTCK